MSGDWRSHFPLAKIRPIQEKALDFVAQAIADGVDDILVEAPTGTGKSPMAIAIAGMCGGYITTSSIALENQYMADFARVGLKQLHAKDWYDCPECDNCRSGNEICSLDEEGAALERLIRKGEESYTPGCLRCPYREARYQFFQKSWCGISNAAYLLTYARFVSPFPRRPVVIFDEAHTLSDWITKLFAVDLTFRDVDHAIKMPKDTKEVWDWLETEICPWLKAEISRLDAQRSETKKRYFTARSIEREWLANTLKVLLRETDRRANQLNNLKVIIQNNPREWVSEIIAEERRIKITPLWPHSVAAPLLEQIAPIRVYLSATLAGMWNQAEWLGIDSRHSGTRFLSLPSPFPVENRPIIIRPKVRWNFRRDNFESAYPQAAEEIELLLAAHEGERGIVHCSSYSQMRKIIQHCDNPRLIAHEDSQGKEEALEELFRRSDGVLISPSSHEGLDLYDDRCRFQIIIKIPYASLGDPVIQARMKSDRHYYAIITTQKLIQACGRGVRSNFDFANTYISDSDFNRFFGNAREFFPAYIRVALRQ